MRERGASVSLANIAILFLFYFFVLCSYHKGCDYFNIMFLPDLKQSVNDAGLRKDLAFLRPELGQARLIIRGRAGRCHWRLTCSFPVSRSDLHVSKHKSFHFSNFIFDQRAVLETYLLLTSNVVRQTCEIFQIQKRIAWKPFSRIVLTSQHKWFTYLTEN